MTSLEFMDTLRDIVFVTYLIGFGITLMSLIKKHTSKTVIKEPLDVIAVPILLLFIFVEAMIWPIFALVSHNWVILGKSILLRRPNFNELKIKQDTKLQP